MAIPFGFELKVLQLGRLSISTEKPRKYGAFCTSCCWCCSPAITRNAAQTIVRAPKMIEGQLIARKVHDDPIGYRVIFQDVEIGSVSERTDLHMHCLGRRDALDPNAQVFGRRGHQRICDDHTSCSYKVDVDQSAHLQLGFNRMRFCGLKRNIFQKD
jgi:hypothetical protein